MAQKKKIKAIIFDLGGVVVHGGYLDFIRHFCAACLTPLGRKKIANLERLANLGEVSEQEFYQKIQKVFRVHMTVKQMHELIVHKMTTDKGLVKFIPQLQKTKVALFSNSIGHMATEVIRRRHIPTRKLFDQVFISSNLHLVKPDRQAYSYVLHQLQVKPREALLVDDRLENIRGAREIGMEGVLYKNFTQFKKALKKYALFGSAES